MWAGSCQSPHEARTNPRLEPAAWVGASLPALHRGRRSRAAAPARARPATPGQAWGRTSDTGDTRETSSSASHLRPRPPAARLSWRSRSLPPRRCALSPAAPAGTRPPPARFSGGEAAGEAAAGGPGSATLTPAPLPALMPPCLATCRAGVRVPSTSKRHSTRPRAAAAAIPAADPASASGRRDRAEQGMAAAPPSPGQPPRQRDGNVRRLQPCPRGPLPRGLTV